MRGTGHEITYDRSGNRLSDTYTGTRVINNFISYGTEKDAETTETYRYDAAGRLSTIRRDGLLIDERHYDDAGRISQSGVSTADGKNKGIYRIEYDYRDAYKELKTTLAADGSVVTRRTMPTATGSRSSTPRRMPCATGCGTV
ncbi:hypothetical protein [Pseudoduganella chitinolytica]|uniref:RHS repeat protein n=1 Tax=Pseudoduganella chitinolytica TaxID=34070 RepID=A0ABY8BF04_9BURK|nr:hypothetical protein [Pseudoduganella chitinolytica]WEF32874.1 hypothetical protein PX653_26350 [Pseudoduganella chitinolytica]